MSFNTSISHNNKPLGFFSLPGEIRNQIYESLLVFSEPITIYTEDWDKHNDDKDASPKDNEESRVHIDNILERKRWPLSSRLLTVFLISKQVYLEASAVFYSQNHFRAPPSLCRFPHAQLQSNYVMRGFIDRIGNRNLTCLRHLCIPFPLDSNNSIISPSRRSFDDGPNTSSTRLDALFLMEMGAGAADTVKLPGALTSLWRRCPNVETIEFDLSWSGPGHSFWKGVRPYDREVLLGSMDAALREEFKRLREIVVNIHFDGIGGNNTKSCEALVEEMREKYGWKVSVRDSASGENQDGAENQRLLRIPYWHRPSPAAPLHFRWNGRERHGSAAYASTVVDDDEDDVEFAKPTTPESKRQLAKDIGRKVVRSRAVGWGLVVVFSPTIPVLMAIDGINKKRRKRKSEKKKLSPGSSTDSLSHRGSLPDVQRIGS
ncbi:hypothetical protein B0T20DRAFT_442822 [Sordaria brevicollis]|uniref:DUF7730 domain-containing protein n=1 Tax=Sordaria brevicollis TaxID=83679 RepID=A0AAE0U9A8_SORBR|nr:hypothetical protein B0T20DRAFT_442822 [Sordaria brevicollis]